ncbi:hypothetical protein [Sporosarcina sp. FSL W7-1283]
MNLISEEFNNDVLIREYERENGAITRVEQLITPEIDEREEKDLTE